MEANATLINAKSVGIAGRNVDIVGYALRPNEISEAVTRALVLLGVKEDQIRMVKVAADAEGHPHIVAEVLYKALKNAKQAERKGSWLDFVEGDDDRESGISPRIYEALKNVAYPFTRKLVWTKVVRGERKYARIEFDPYLFMAVVYDINYADRFYKISAPVTRFYTDEQLEEMSGKERKEYQRRIQEYKAENLKPCTFYITFKKDSVFRVNGDADQTVTGFHPAEVEYVHHSETKDKKKKKHH